MYGGALRLAPSPRPRLSPHACGGDRMTFDHTRKRRCGGNLRSKAQRPNCAGKPGEWGYSKQLGLPLVHKYVLILRPFMVQYLLHLQREGLTWPEVVLLRKPSLDRIIHCSLAQRTWVVVLATFCCTYRQTQQLMRVNGLWRVNSQVKCAHLAPELEMCM